MNTYTTIDQRDLLSDLVATVQRFPEASDRYFSRIGETHQLNPIREDVQALAPGASEPIPPEFLDEMGIRSITLNRMHDSFTLPSHFSRVQRRDATQLKWQVFRDTIFIENLQTVLQDCPVITFSDWAGVDNASQLWDGFLRDVIKPLKKTDINFIFYLGDLTKRLTYEVDEVIDIISDFSTYGNVTFLLHEREASELWRILNGDVSGHFPASPESLDRYHSIFNAMKVDRLLVYSIDHAMLFSSTSRFELQARMFASHYRISQQDKDHFNAGYSLGLLLQLDIPHAIALGLATYGAFLENGISPNRRALAAYLNDWVKSLA